MTVQRYQRRSPALPGEAIEVKCIGGVQRRHPIELRPLDEILERPVT